MHILSRIKHEIKQQVKVRVFDEYVSWKTKEKIIDLPSHTLQENRQIWDNYDWSQKGEEWTFEAKDPGEWKKNLLEKMMFLYIQSDSIILEIGPGAGRWSEHLQKIAKKLILVDIAPNCLDLCKKRFAEKSNVEYYLIENNIDFLSNNSVDYVWSYDVFVHINPSDIARYIQNINRILRKEGIAIIHHSGGEYVSKDVEIRGFRARMTAEKFRELVTAANMEIMEQNRDLVHKKGDIISVFRS